MIRTSKIRGNLLLPDRNPAFGSISIEGGVIARIDIESTEARSGFDLIAPGFIDAHVHGGGGADVMDASPGAIDAVTATHARHGTTSMLASTVSAPPDEIGGAIDRIRRYRDKGGRSVVGIHLEGPFLNPAQRGAMKPDYIIPPDTKLLLDWVERGEGLVKMITLAPEVDGAEELIAEARTKGIVVSAGHSMASWEDMERAEPKGVRHLTHLFNAMRALGHHEPGLIGYALRHGGMSMDFIADGHHLHPAIVDMLITLAGPERLMLVTDAMRAAGLGDGEYESAGLRVSVSDGIARIGNGSLAGSLLTMDEAFSRIVRVHGRSLAEASLMASANPAKLLGLERSKGSIALGKDADIVCLSPEGAVTRTIIDGDDVWPIRSAE
jgi:N-acetylglucosamine-6-phosphate deacetylase